MSTSTNNISEISSSQAPSTTQVLTTTPTPIPTREVVFYTTPPEESTPQNTLPPITDEGVLTSNNISTQSYYGSMRLYFKPEYESCYSTKFIATLSDINYIKFNGDNSNVDIHEEGSNKVSFDILNTTTPAYIGLDFCSYKNSEITNIDSAYKIGTVTINSNEWFKYKYSNTYSEVDNTYIEVDSTEIGIRLPNAECFNNSLYKKLPQINISYTYQTFTNTFTYFNSIKENIQINLEPLSNKPDNINNDFKQNISINANLDLPFGLSKDLFKDNGKCFLSIVGDDNTSDTTNKYNILKDYFKYEDGELGDYKTFINTPIKPLYLKAFPSENISITLKPYIRYNYSHDNPFGYVVYSSYTITINVPDTGQSTPPTTTTKSPTTNPPSNTGSPIP